MLKKPKILVVDDDELVLSLYVAVLKPHYALFSYTSAEKVLRNLDTLELPDLVITDLSMPKIDGFEFIKRLKQNKKWQHVYIIAITGFNNPDIETRCIELGVVDIITKPINIATFLGRVKNYVKLKGFNDKLLQLVEDKSQKLEVVKNVVIYALALLAEYRDPETGKHIKRTQEYVKILANKLKYHPRFSDVLTDEVIDILYSCAPLHDIGKVGIQDSILFKKEDLTEAEFEIIKLHTCLGKQVLEKLYKLAEFNNESLDFLVYAIDLCYTHHEKWDGTGYHKFEGENIPVVGRLMALADIYDALTSKRAYKDALTHEEAYRVITQGDGRTRPEDFDPDVLKAFIDIQDMFKTVSLELSD